MSLTCARRPLDQHNIVFWHITYRLQYFYLREIEFFSVLLYKISHPCGKWIILCSGAKRLCLGVKDLVCHSKKLTHLD